MNTTVVNTETMCELLQKLAELKLVCPNSIVLDNTKYQRSTIVQVLVTELGIWLLFLPSNSPNLNVIERI